MAILVWVNVGVLSLIPLYIIDFKFFDKLNIGLQRKIALAKERGHVARGMIVKEDAKRLVVNNSQSAYSYWAARYTYTVDGKEYRKRFSCDNKSDVILFGTKNPLYQIQWLADFCYLHFDKLFMPDATQSQAPYSLLHSLIFQTH